MLERWNRGKKDAILGWEDGGGGVAKCWHQAKDRSQEG